MLRNVLKHLTYVCHLSGFLLSGHYCLCCIWCHFGKLQSSEDKIWQFARKPQEICHNSRKYSTVLPHYHLTRNLIHEDPMEKYVSKLSSKVLT